VGLHVDTTAHFLVNSINISRPQRFASVETTYEINVIHLRNVSGVHSHSFSYRPIYLITVVLLRCVASRPVIG